MEELIAQLAKARHVLQMAEHCRDNLLLMVQDTPEWKRYESQRTEVEQLKLEVQEADAAVREAALADYQMTGAKHLYAGVEVKLYTKVTYDANRARAYCISHDIPGALKLDEKAWLKIAPALALDWVAIEDEPRATVPANLSAYVPAPEPEPVPEVAVIESVPA